QSPCTRQEGTLRNLEASYSQEPSRTRRRPNPNCGKNRRLYWSRLGGSSVHSCNVSAGRACFEIQDHRRSQETRRGNQGHNEELRQSTRENKTLKPRRKGLGQIHLNRAPCGPLYSSGQQCTLESSAEVFTGEHLPDFVFTGGHLPVRYGHGRPASGFCGHRRPPRLMSSPVSTFRKMSSPAMTSYAR